jgi:hypothetical protein
MKKDDFENLVEKSILTFGQMINEGIKRIDEEYNLTPYEFVNFNLMLFQNLAGISLVGMVLSQDNTIEEKKSEAKKIRDHFIESFKKSFDLNLESLEEIEKNFKEQISKN